MIQPKLKTCSTCKQKTILWRANPPSCKTCWLKIKASNEVSTTKPYNLSKTTKSSAKRIKSVSDKMLGKLKEYRMLRDAYMSGNPICEVSGCGRVADDLHHRKPRAYHLCDVSIFMAVCRLCHTRIESDDTWARSKGYKLNHL